MACCVTVKTSVISLVTLIIIHAVVNKNIAFNVQTQGFLLVDDYTCTSFDEMKNLIKLIVNNYQKYKNRFCETSKNVISYMWVLSVLFTHVAYCSK